MSAFNIFKEHQNQNRVTKKGFRLSVLAYCVSAVVGGTAYADDVIDLGTVSASRTTAPAEKLDQPRLKLSVKKDLPLAAQKALSQGSLEASSAQSQVSDSYIRNALTPNSDFAQVVDLTPGTFSFSPNGPGLGQSKTYFRGFSDGNYSMTFDGIPFQDTNSPTHHSWVFFPGQIIGGAVVDRSPGTASTLGPANFGGSINLLSRDLTPNPSGSVTASYGSWDTRLFAAQVDTGNFGPDGSSNLMINAHQMNSDGYERGNDQQRQNISAKYQYALTDKTTLTLFGTTEEVKANTADSSPTRSSLAQYGNNFYLSDDPKLPNYTGYNFYRVHTDFEYLGLVSDLGSGWKVDNKLYAYDYHNTQFFDSNFSTPYPDKASNIGPTSAIDKLNAYHTYGDILRLSQDSKFGTLRFGAWVEQANTNRYQIPSNPITQVDTFPSKFEQAFTTKILQPYLEYDFRPLDGLDITPGVKYAHYDQSFTQYPSKKTYPNKPVGVGPVISSSATYSDWQPSIDVHYMLQKNWSVYAQYAYGDVIPLSSVYDVAVNKQGVQLVVNPKPTLSKTAQIGTVWKSDAFTLDVDAYHINFDNAYSSSVDPVTGETNYFAAGTSTAQGVEAESNIVLGKGLSLYLNATYGTNKYNSGSLKGQTAAQSPTNTQAIGLTYALDNWNVGIVDKRIGSMWNANGATPDAVKIDAFNVMNVSVNYTMPWASHPSMSTKFQFAVNNLFSSQDLVGVTPANAPTASSAFTPSDNDQLTLTAPRSFTFSVTQNF
jgi:iron complex outermembrane receptor protein